MRMCSTVRAKLVIIMNLKILRYEGISLHKAVEAESSMMMGASIMKERGMIMPPYAARLISAPCRRARIALIKGLSNPINSQLAASGHQVLMICLLVTDMSKIIIQACHH